MFATWTPAARPRSTRRVRGVPGARDARGGAAGSASDARAAKRATSRAAAPRRRVCVPMSVRAAAYAAAFGSRERQTARARPRAARVRAARRAARPRACSRHSPIFGARWRARRAPVPLALDAPPSRRVAAYGSRRRRRRLPYSSSRHSCPRSLESTSRRCSTPPTAAVPRATGRAAIQRPRRIRRDRGGRARRPAYRPRE